MRHLLFLTVVLFLAASSARAAEVVTFKATDGVTLTGTFFSAHGPTRHPAIVILGGSGKELRINPISQTVAEQFTSAGFSVFAFDKRGLGDSEGTYNPYASMEALGDDALAAVHAVRGRPDVDPKQVGVWALSQGGFYAPYMAQHSSGVAFIINVSGPGVSIGETNIYQMGTELLHQGFSPIDVREVDDYRRVLWSYFGTGLGQEAVNGVAAQFADRTWFAKLHFSKQTPRIGDIDKGMQAAMRSFLFDPTDAASHVTVPVMNIYGEKDGLVPVNVSIANLMIAYHRAGNQHVGFIVYPNVGHGMVPVMGAFECHECMEKDLQATHKWTPIPQFFPDTIAWLRSVLAT